MNEGLRFARLEAAMRLILTRPDGANVEVRIPGGYAPDVWDDVAARAKALLDSIDTLPVEATP